MRVFWARFLFGLQSLGTVFAAPSDSLPNINLNQTYQRVYVAISMTRNDGLRVYDFCSLSDPSFLRRGTMPKEGPLLGIGDHVPQVTINAEGLIVLEESNLIF